MASQAAADANGRQAEHHPDPAMSGNVQKCPVFDETQIRTVPDALPDDPLSDRQRAALELMLGGATDVAIAAAVGVSVRTLYRWRMQDDRFRNRLDRRRLELYDCTLDRFRSLLSGATEVLEKHLRERYAPTALRAARTVLVLARVGRIVAEAAATASRQQPDAAESDDDARMVAHNADIPAPGLETRRGS
jgi:hypothetical protein